MPMEGSVGCGEHTQAKQAVFATIFATHASIVAGIVKKGWAENAYHYLDLTAGSGYCQGRPGSALIAVCNAERVGISLRAWLFERDPRTVVELRDNVRGEIGDIHVVEGDHNEMVGPVVEPFALGRTPRYGLVYWDGNAEARVPVGAIRQVTDLRCFARMDILLYVSAASIKRWLRRGGLDGCQRLEDIISGLGKQRVLVREPMGPWQFTFILATNWEGSPEFRRQKFAPIDSRRGKEILDVLNYTASEREEMSQPPLPFSDCPDYDAYLRHPFYRAVRAQAIKRSRGICERCHKREVTEVHHLCYPPWGTFDVAENLLAVCHPCHCELEGKEK